MIVVLSAGGRRKGRASEKRGRCNAGQGPRLECQPANRLPQSPKPPWCHPFV
jgi:hypothetical protein